MFCDFFASNICCVLIISQQLQARRQNRPFGCNQLSTDVQIEVTPPKL
jgi:hypothetical protein